MLVMACATTPETPPARVAGCWIDRADTVTTTMRWLPDQARPGVLTGDLLEYPQNGTQGRRARYTLEPTAEGWNMCSHWQEAPVCRQVAQGETGSLEGGRVFIDAYRERLRIAFVEEDGYQEIIFEGRRDGCD